MPSYLVIIGAIVVFFKDLFKGAGKSRESKILLVSVVLYFLYIYLKKKEDEADYQKLNNKAGTWAMRLHKALHPILPVKVPLFGYFDDGTNESEVIAVANEMGKLDKAGTNENLAEVQNAFKVLYGDDLKEALLSDKVLEDFEAAYDAAIAGTTANNAGTVLSSPATGASISNANNLIVQVGQSYVSKGGVNLRDNASPYTVKGSTTTGDIYRVYQLKKNMIIGGNSYVVAFCQRVRFGLPNPFEDYMLIINAFTRKA